MLEALGGSPVSDSDGALCYLFALHFRLRPDGNRGMLAAAEMFASLYRYVGSATPPLPDNGSCPRIQIEKTASQTSRNSGGTRDFTVKLRYLWREAPSPAFSYADGTALPSLELVICGHSVGIAPDGVYRLLDAKGLEACGCGVDLYGCGSCDGSFISGLKAKARDITLTFDFGLDGTADARREYLISTLAPSAEGILTATRGGVSRSIGCVVSSLDYNTDISAGAVRVKIGLTCPDPFFRDAAPVVYTLHTVVPLLTFPFNSSAAAGITASVKRGSYEMTLVNGGHTDAGVLITLTASGTRVTNPSVARNGEYIRILDTLETGDVYSVDTTPGRRCVQKNGVDCFLFDRRSVFFTLPPGQSDVTVSADAGLDLLDATLTCSLRYYGI